MIGTLAMFILSTELSSKVLGIREISIQISKLMKVNFGSPGVFPGALPHESSNKTKPIIPLQRFTGGKELEEMNNTEAESRFYLLVMNIHLYCENQRRFGHENDGGWDVCLDRPFYPSHNCNVYSFGINWDFSFDDAISKLNCTVHSFDPSMNTNTHQRSPNVYFYKIGIGGVNIVNKQGWIIRTFGTILKHFKHQDKIIDYLKIDVEYNEWSSLLTMLREGSLRNVKQIGMEIHTRVLFKNELTITHIDRDEYFIWYGILYELEKQGFRRYKYHINPMSETLLNSQKETISCCLELYYININFLEN